MRGIKLAGGVSAALIITVMSAGAASAVSADTTGPYTPSGVVAASDNGNGGGNATGRPDAGSVGNADTKNPSGQLPGPNDRNKGYECDGNNGVAKGNPAHSTCQPDPGDTPG